MIILHPRAYIRDIVSFIRCLNLIRIRNAIVLRISFYYSVLRKRVWQLGSPLALAIETYAGCTLRCPECPEGSAHLGRQKGAMTIDTFQKAIVEAGQGLFYLALHFLGEPLLNPQLWEMISFAKKKHLYTEIHTNGQLLIHSDIDALLDSGLCRMRISVDGSTQESYALYRKGGDLEKIIEGTRRLAEAREKRNGSGPFIIWQSIVFRHNEHQREDIIRLARQSGADAVDFKTAWVKDEKDKENLLPINRKYNRYHKKTVNASACWKSWHSAVISKEGELLACCFDKRMEYSLGNIKSSHLLDLWTAEKYTAFRRKMMDGSHPLCEGCTA